MPESVLTLGLGDGGNEVGMGRVVHLEGISTLSPGGEYAALSVNGTFRSCDHALLSTVSNWGGTAFELAAHLLYPNDVKVDYVGALLGAGKSITEVEDHLLAAIMAPGAVSVDGVLKDQEHSVDGMVFEPHHKGLYDLLWGLATRKSED